MSFWVTGGMAVLSAYSASEQTKAGNKAAQQEQINADRRYSLQAGVSENQMEEQQMLATEKMTEVTRAFIVAKGKAKAIQAETMVTGVSAKRIAANTRSKFSEATSKIAKEIDTNVVNIAQGMLASKIDTEAAIANAENRKRNVFTATAIGGLQGAASGYSIGSNIGAGTKPSTVDKPTSLVGSEYSTNNYRVSSTDMGF